MEIQKDAITATGFVRKLSVPKRAQTAILHTRLTTQGSELNNLNNHPIRSGAIVGVHNGVLYNDDELFVELGVGHLRNGQVDSEAIFAALNYGFDLEKLKDGTTRTALAGDRGEDVETIADVLSRVEGSAAVAFLDKFDANDTLHVARLNQSPFCWAQTEGGSFLFASTVEAVNAAAGHSRLRIVAEGAFKEGEYARVVAGVMTEFEKFTPAWTPSTYRGFGGKYTYTTPFHAGQGSSTAKNGSTGHESTSDHARPSTFLDARLLDMGDDLAAMDSGTHNILYSDREHAISEWTANLQTQEDQQLWQATLDLHCWARSGDWVSTTVAGMKVWAQLYRLPHTFPNGDYVLRAMVPGDDGSFEPVFVKRQWYGFEPCSGLSGQHRKPDLKALPPVTPADHDDPDYAGELSAYDR